MTLPKYNELKDLNSIIDIDKEIFILQKTIFTLKMKKTSVPPVKSHLFTHAKRRIAQLNFKKSSLLKTSSN
jgi:ribosomal protein L29